MTANNVIPLFKRAAWLRIKRMVESGRVYLPPAVLPKLELPISDGAIALAYALSCREGSK
jgi:hypothetical protein